MRGGARAPLALAAALAAASGPALAGPAPEGPPAFVVARVPDAGSTAVEALAGRPFQSLRLEHAFFPVLDVGLVFDQSSGGFYRFGGQLRGRVVRVGEAEVALRVAVVQVQPVARSGFGARIIARTFDGEAGLLASYPVLPALALFAEGALLGETDFGHPHTAGFVQVQGGAEWAALGPFSLVGRYGVLKGARGSAALGSAGLGIRF